LQGVGLLRNPAGASSLATKKQPKLDILPCTFFSPAPTTV
jgi:hypothetical protein